MKHIQSITFRALCAAFIGALLIAFPDNTTKWLVVVIGVLFFIPGLVSFGAYFRLKKDGGQSLRPLFPILGLGSILFGLLLIIFASALMDYMKYVLAAFLVLAGVSSAVSMVRFRTVKNVALFFFIVPVLIMLVGIFVFLYRELEPTVVHQLLGGTSIAYALFELIAGIAFRKVRRQLMEPATDDAPPAEPSEPQEPQASLPEPETQTEQTEEPLPEEALQEAEHSQPQPEPEAQEPQKPRETIDFTADHAEKPKETIDFTDSAAE